MTTFLESGLRFEFDKQWIIQKYDAHRYYTYLSGAGLKAVDFAGIRDEQVYLIEVKNYQIRYEGKPYYKIYDFIESPEQLMEIILKKMADTQRAVRIIHEYLSRKWLYRLLYPRLAKWRLPKSGKRTWWYWAKLYHLLEEEQQGTLVLAIATEKAYEGYSEQRVNDFLATLQHQLKTNIEQEGFSFEILLLEKELVVEGIQITQVYE